MGKLLLIACDVGILWVLHLLREPFNILYLNILKSNRIFLRDTGKLLLIACDVGILWVPLVPFLP